MWPLNSRMVHEKRTQNIPLTGNGVDCQKIGNPIVTHWMPLPVPPYRRPPEEGEKT